MQAAELPTPCPNRIVDDTGGAFCMGAIGGAAWHFGKGVRNSPKGMKWRGGLANMRLRAPTLGGNFAVWGLLFSACDCTIAHIRRRDDAINAVASGAVTGGILAARAGWKAIGRNAAVGGVLLAAIEGVTMGFQYMMQPSDPMGAAPIPEPKKKQITGSASSLAGHMRVGSQAKALALTSASSLREDSAHDDFAFDDDHDFSRHEAFA